MPEDFQKQLEDVKRVMYKLGYRSGQAAVDTKVWQAIEQLRSEGHHDAADLVAKIAFDQK